MAYHKRIDMCLVPFRVGWSQYTCHRLVHLQICLRSCRSSSGRSVSDQVAPWAQSEVLNFSVDWGCGNERLVIIKTLIYHSRKLNQIQLTNSCEILWSILREYEIITISVHGQQINGARQRSLPWVLSHRVLTSQLLEFILPDEDLTHL